MNACPSLVVTTPFEVRSKMTIPNSFSKVLITLLKLGWATNNSLAAFEMEPCRSTAITNSKSVRFITPSNAFYKHNTFRTFFPPAAT